MSDGGEALAARLLGWRGQPDLALKLRAEVRQHPSLRIKGKPPPGVRGLAKAIELYRSEGRSPSTLAGWLIKERNASEAAVFSPLIGDPEMGTWPHDRPFELSEPDVVLWSEIFARMPVVVDASLRRFIGVAFQIRRRQTWPAACRAWAALAQTDEPLRLQLQLLWRRCYPELGQRWPSSGLSAGHDHLGANWAHLLRHALMLGCCWRAIGGDLQVAGVEGSRLASMPLPANDADRSVVLGAILELLPTDPSGIAAQLGRRARELRADELSEVYFRRLLGELPEGPAAEAIRSALIRPRWKPLRVDALWEWLNTAAWLQERGDTEAIAQMAASAGEAGDALAWRLGSDAPPSTVDALIQRLRQLLDPDRLAVVPPRRRAPLLVETRLLMHSEDVRELPWPALVRLAGGDGSGILQGTVAEVGEPSLCVLLTERALTSRTLMRDVQLAPDNVLQIGGVQDGFVASQVAVQTERILRELSSPSDQVRFLWKLLQQDPPFKTFAELDLILRSELVLPGAGHNDSPSPLHAMVKSVSTLDQRRDEGADVSEIAKAFVSLVHRTQTLLGSEDQVASAIEDLARGLEAVVASDDDPVMDPNWMHQLEQVVLGNELLAGLVGWSWWLDHPEASHELLHPHRAQIGKALTRLSSAVELVRSMRPSVTVEQHEELSEACSVLQGSIGTLGWPETQLLEHLLERLQLRSAEALSEGRRSRAAVKILDGLLESADEEALAKLIRDPVQLSLMPVEQLHRIHHALLGQLRFADADHLRRVVAERLQLPSRITHMVPLFSAVAGGTFLVLDLGDAWLDLVAQEAWDRYAVTVVLALGASYSLLLNDLAPRIRSMGRSRSQRWLTLAVRTLPTFLQAEVLSLAVSAVAMATLGTLTWDATGLLTLILWSALALFLGVFIGLIVQGQSITRR
ncbi:MAG TPA: hypothetical protein ENK18_15910 [Deltaproteobacteria bacterium]|nr:hypothetical protein [Deltaproteobacteria bacterium]